MTYSPRTGLVYIPAMDSAALFEVGASTERALLGGAALRIDQGFGKDTELHYKSTGRLIAWDPVSQKERWHRNAELRVNGGVLRPVATWSSKAAAPEDNRIQGR